jgi:triacylglycerol lipase
MGRLKGLRDLLHDTVDRVTHLVEETHEASVAKTVRILGVVEPVGQVTRGVEAVRRPVTAGVYASIRATNRAVQGISDLTFEVAEGVLETRPVEPALPAAAGDGAAAGDDAGPADRWLDTAQAALNAAFGDFLEERGNGLATSMGLWHGGRPLPIERTALEATWPDATGRLCVFVHGLGCTEREWCLGSERAWGRAGVCYGSLLRQDAGYTPAFVRYNTGLHISDNGRRLAALLDALVAAHPKPVEEVVLVGHSMGGLVSRSAVHYGAQAGARWVDVLSNVICIGSPHHGAPLEKASNLLASVLGWFDTAGTQVPAKLLRARSAGIKDLRHGNIVEEDWQGCDPDGLDDTRTHACLVDGVGYYSVSGCITPDADHPLGRLLGDVMVQVPSASGHHDQPERHIAFEGGDVLAGVGHMALMNHPKVYEIIRRALDPGGDVSEAPLLDP